MVFLAFFPFPHFRFRILYSPVTVNDDDKSIVAAHTVPPRGKQKYYFVIISFSYLPPCMRLPINKETIALYEKYRG